MPLDPLQRRRVGRWPDIEMDEAVGLLPQPGPVSPTVVTVPAESPPAWPAPLMTTLVRQIETVVLGSGKVPEGKRSPTRTAVTTYNPFRR